MFDQSELRIISLSAPLWLKLLRKKETQILNRIYGAFKSGDHNQMTNLAEFCTVREQIRDIESQLTKLEESPDAAD